MVKKSKKGADVEMKEASKSTTNGTATESGQSEEPKAEVSKEEQEKLVLEGMVWDKLWLVLSQTLSFIICAPQVSTVNSIVTARWL